MVGERGVRGGNPTPPFFARHTMVGKKGYVGVAPAFLCDAQPEVKEGYVGCPRLRSVRPAFSKGRAPRAARPRRLP